MGSKARPAVDPFARIAPHYDVLMSSVPYAKWADYVCQLAALSGEFIRPGSRLLDLATGTGSVALEFAARGCVVTGIDISEPMLAEARRKASEQGFDIQFLCSDLSSFDLLGQFDCAVCLYDSLNYILDPRDLKRAFANMHKALRADGLLIFDVNTVHALEAELFTQESLENAPVQYRWVSRYNPQTKTSHIRMKFHVRATGERFSAVHHQRAYSDAELRTLLGQTGFRDVRAYDAYRLSSLLPSSDRAFYAARVQREARV